MARLGPLSRGLGAVGLGAWFIGRAGKGIWRGLIDDDPLAQHRIASAIGLFLWRPLLTLVPLAALTGIIAGIGTARLLGLYQAELPIVGGLVQALLRDIEPIIVGVFASGSVSVELASRLGGMSLNREIDALEVMGHDPAIHILSPSLAAVVAAAPVHMICAACAALATAGLALEGIANLSFGEFARLALTDDAARSLLTGVMKALLFSLIAFAVGAVVGSRPLRSPADIGRRATTAFTAGLLGIFTAAALWASLA